MHATSRRPARNPNPNSLDFIVRPCLPRAGCCGGSPVHSLLPQGRGYTTLELKVNYVRAMQRDTGRVQAIGKVIHLGGRIATAEGTLVDAAGKLYAHATTTCLLSGPDRSTSR